MKIFIVVMLLLLFISCNSANSDTGFVVSGKKKYDDRYQYTLTYLRYGESANYDLEIVSREDWDVGDTLYLNMRNE